MNARSYWEAPGAYRLWTMTFQVEGPDGHLISHNMQVKLGAPDLPRGPADVDVALWLRSGWWATLRHEFAAAPDIAVDVLSSVADELSALTAQATSARGQAASDLAGELEHRRLSRTGPQSGPRAANTNTGIVLTREAEMWFRSSWKRVRVAGPWLAIAVGVLLTLNGMSGALAATTPVHHRRSRPTCKELDNALLNKLGEEPTALTMAPDPQVTAMFGILRRPAGPEDQLPPRSRPELPYLGLGSYFSHYVRQLVKAPSERVVMAPGFRRAYPVPPARCLPKKDRNKRSQLVAEQHKREQELSYCITYSRSKPHGHDVTTHCMPFSGIPSGENFVGTASSQSRVAELVPDGVALVRLSYRNGTVITAPIANENVLIFTPPQALIKKAINKGIGALLSVPKHKRSARLVEKALRSIATEAAPKTVEWVSRGGQTIKTMSPRITEEGAYEFLLNPLSAESIGGHESESSQSEVKQVNAKRV